MKGQIVCHIGPPKTATTSLQFSLEAFKRQDFLYIGAFQPRARNAGSLSQRLYSLCAASSNRDLLEEKSVITELKSELAFGQTIFLSEEMFLVDQSLAPYPEKIKTLGRILSGLPCRIIITARSPLSALPSYFQEVFPSLPVHLQLDFAKFCRDQRAQCYDYEKLIEIIRLAGFETTVVIDFDRLSNGTISLGELTGKSEHFGIDLAIEKHNSGLVGAAPQSRLVPRVSLKQVGRFRVVEKAVEKLNLRQWSGYRHCAALLDNISLRKAAHRELIVPPDVAERLEAGYQRVRQQHSEANV